MGVFEKLNDSFFEKFQLETLYGLVEDLYKKINKQKKLQDQMMETSRKNS